MQINRNYAIGVLKTDLLKLFVLYKDMKAIKKAQRRFEKNIVKYSCSFCKERSNVRSPKATERTNSPTAGVTKQAFQLTLTSCN